MTFVFRAVVLALGVTGMIHSISIAAAPDYSADVARAMRSGDYAQARTLLRERAQAGDAEAQLNLGALLATGRGGRPDPAQAARWYRKAAEQGNASAQYNLGTLYAQGTGVTRDMSQAVHWWRKAAEQGVIAAQYNMGAASADGVGVDQSDAAAVYWFANAAASGNDRASTALDDLATRLPTKQVTGSHVRVRSAASTSSEIVGRVSEPARVPVLGRTRDGWIMVYLSEQQRLGWIADSLLSAQTTPP
jgi:FOG: TPR repeat, SEL1 subfamily